MAFPAYPLSTRDQTGAALQQAGQYAGDPNAWTTANAPGLGLDPARGYVATGTPTDTPQSAAPAVASPLPGPTPMPTKDDISAYPGAIPEGQPIQKGDQKDDTPEYPGVIRKSLDPTAQAQADAFKKQQQLGQPAGSQPGTGQPKELGKDDSDAYPGVISDEQHAQSQQPAAVPQPTPAQPQAQPQDQPTGQVSGAPTGTAAQPWGVQQPATPMPSGTGAGAPQGQPADPQAQIQALIASGLSPGAAQAIIAGQKPTTISGAPAAPPKPPKPQPSPAPEDATQPDKSSTASGEISGDTTPPAATTPAAPSTQSSAAEIAEKQYVEAEKAKLTQQPAQSQQPASTAPITPADAQRYILSTYPPDASAKDKAAVQNMFTGKGKLTTRDDGNVWWEEPDGTASSVGKESDIRALMPNQSGQAPAAPSGSTTDEPKTIVGGAMLKGTSTVFGLNYDGSVDTQDNGRGIFGANTRNPKLKGVAVPVDVLEATFGHAFESDGKGGYQMVNTPEAKKVIQAIQSAHVEAIGADGKIHNYPIVDIQGSLKGHPGKVLDLTYGAAKDLGFNDNHSISYQIVGGDGKPYAILADQLAGWNSGGGTSSGSKTASRDPFAGQPLFSIPSEGSGGSASQSQQTPSYSGGGRGGGGGAPVSPEAGSYSSPGWGAGGGLADIAAGVVIGSALRGGGRGGQQQAAEDQGPQAPQAPQNPLVTALMNRGFTQAQAINYAQGVQNIAPGKGIGPLGPPPAAPSQLPAPSGVTLSLSPKQPVEAKLLSAKQLMPSFKGAKGLSGKSGPPPSAPGTPSVTPSASARQTGTKAPPPPAPSAPATPAVDPSVVLGLIKRGFTREQALAFASRATVSQPGGSSVAGSKSFRAPSTSPSVSHPASPASAPMALGKRQLEAAQPAEYERSEGSTHGDPNPPGMNELEGLKLPAAAQQHASILSPDDPRVKKQADGMIKGEHFVQGDPFHDSLLNNLPGGKGGRQRQILGQAEQAIADKEPMHISYLSAPKEAEKFPTRESRKVQYDAHSPEARLMGTTEGQLVGHSFIPVSVGVKLPAKAGEPHQSYIQGISTNVLANNFHHINAKLAEMGRSTPYPELGPKFSNDLEGYLSNLLAGHSGTGNGYVVGTSEYPSEPDRNHVPYKLTRNEADFLNAAINNTAAFAKHPDAQNLRELARANGTLITPAGETNRLRHDIEQHEPGWRQKVLEPTIRSFKTGLIQATHPNEQNMPDTIRSGREYRDITRAIQRTSYRGRPDVGLSISPRSQPTVAMPRDLMQNRAINKIERDFSEHRIDEKEAHARLREIGENPGEYRFIGGSGGLISPYESNPTAITAEEHAALKDNLRKKWIGGNLDIENYQRRVAEVPLPELRSRSASQTASQETPLSVAKPAPLRTPKLEPKPQVPELEESETPKEPEVSELTASTPPTPKPPKEPVEPPEAPTSPTPAPAKPKFVKPAPEEPEEPKSQPPAPDEPLPAKKPQTAQGSVAFMPGGKAAPVAPTKAVAPQEEKELVYKEMSPAQKEAYVAGRVKDRLANQIKGAVKLRPALEDDGSYQRDDAGNPQWEKGNYDLVNSPILGNKRLDRAKDQKFKDQEDIYSKDEHTHLNDIDRKRLSYLEQKSAVGTMADKIVDAYHTHMVNEPSVMAAKGWYTNMQQKLKQAFGPDAEIFAQLLGATSARTGVHQNFIQSLDAYDQLKSGKFDNHIAKYNEAHEHLARGEGALAKHMHDSGIVQEMLDKGTMPIDKKTGKPKELKTDAAAMAAWIAHHDILPRQKNGQKFNANSNQVLKVLAQKWLQSVKAPKTPNFSGNLSGRTRESTIDVWAARFLHELGNEGNKKPWMLQPGGESGVRGLDFSYAQRAFRKAADKLGIEPDDLQATSWYLQKHLWDQRGHTKGQGAKKASFDQTFDRIFSPSGERMSDEEVRQAFAGEKDEPEEEEEEAA
jgi:hypothetical protein